MHTSIHPASADPAEGYSQLSFRRFGKWAALALTGAALAISVSAQTNSGYTQTNIVSDGSVPAQKTDPTLLNPWGISFDQQDLWVNAAGSGVDIVEDTAGNRAFAVTIPAASSKTPHGLPSGTVFNADPSAFTLPGSTYAYFLFCSLDGQVSGWNPNTPSALVALDNSAKNAVYTDLALDKNSNGTYILLANYGPASKVEVYDKTFQPATLSGSFTDPNLPAGYSPFGIHVIGNTVFVTYAQHDPTTGREAIGAGLGVVDTFDLNGNFVTQAIVNGSLNAPWGMALAPAGFGTYANDLLVGNFGDGVINVYDPTSYKLLGQLADSSGKPLANASLWEILFVSSSVGDPNTLYFAAGLDQEQHGLLGAITTSSPPAATGNFALASAQASLTISSSAPANTTISVTPANGFTGTVNFACSGLPTGASCSFSPATVTVASQAAMTTLTISTSSTGTPNPYQVGSNGTSMPVWPVTLALLLPLSFFGMRRGYFQASNRRMLLVVVVIGSAAFLSGCGGNSMKPPVTTPTPAATTSQVTVTATAGALTQTTVISLTVQ